MNSSSRRQIKQRPLFAVGFFQELIQGVISGGAFSGFSHTTDRKVPSEVVLMGSFISVIYGNVR